MAEPIHVHPPTVYEDPLRVALDCLEEGFQIIGPDWRYVYVNPAAARHGRRDASELIGTPIIEATSGNTGISIAGVGRAMGHPVTIFRPDWMSRERVDLIRSLGADIHLVSPEQGGFCGCIERAEIV